MSLNLSSWRSLSADGVDSGSLSRCFRMSADVKLESPRRPPNSTSASSMTLPRRMSGTLNFAMVLPQLLGNEFESFVMRVHGAGAGYLVVVSFNFGEAPDFGMDDGPGTAAGAGFVPGHGHAVPAQQSAPMRLDGKIEPTIAPGLRAFTRQQSASLVVDQEWDQIGQWVDVAEWAHARRPKAHLAHAEAIERIFFHADESAYHLLVVLLEDAPLGAAPNARQRIGREQTGEAGFARFDGEIVNGRRRTDDDDPPTAVALHDVVEERLQPLWRRLLFLNECRPPREQRGGNLELPQFALVLGCLQPTAQREHVGAHASRVRGHDFAFIPVIEPAYGRIHHARIGEGALAIAHE